MFDSKKILVIGGTGSLGHAFVKRYIHTQNEIWIMSRDEYKHWKMNLTFAGSPTLHFIIGDIRDSRKVDNVILTVNPHIIILMAAMKHIDKCENDTYECIQTNLIGTQNVYAAIQNHRERISRLETVCFVSTDKACSPVNIYGMCKAASECVFIEASKNIPEVRFVVVRYGNVLNSRGSIILILHDIGQDNRKKSFNITDNEMTRFVMTLEDSVNLIEHAITFAPSGSVVIPQLLSMRVIDLFEIFSDIYGKPIVCVGLRHGEKMLESLINETQSRRLVKSKKGDYYYILPSYTIQNGFQSEYPIQDYNSLINPLSKIELHDYLKKLHLLEGHQDL